MGDINLSYMRKLQLLRDFRLTGDFVGTPYCLVNPSQRLTDASLIESGARQH
jgi:hypothetical protein